MSGIVGIINLDGAPVDRHLLARMTEFMSYRGPDAQEIWIDGNAGFGHTMLRTTVEAETEKQPLTLDGKVWLTADARIDGRAELMAELESKLNRPLRFAVRSNGHRSDLRVPNDAELILLAYEAWGEDCVKHLIGDFAFAIWDSRKRQLFCARDHFGVKPFFYARLGSLFILSNTLNCLRLHPAVSDRINERFIGDFLLFDMSRDPAISAFADIQRLAPAHSLTYANQRIVLSRYWSLPAHGHIRYRKAAEYVEQFNDLMHRATKDRLRTKHAGILMSGGIDSPTVAAFAREIFSEHQDDFDLRAHTVVYDRLFKDQEHHYSKLVADKLNIPIHYLVADDYDLYDECGENVEQRRPEPRHDPLARISSDQMQHVAQHSRVVLTGYGLDPAVTHSHTYGPDLIKRLRFGELTKSALWFLLVRHQLPALGFRGWVKNFRKLASPQYPIYPAWLNESFASRANLQERWGEINKKQLRTDIERPQGYRSLTSPFWPYRFEDFDPGTTSVPCETRHPFFDVRLITYLLAIPAVPWCIGKELIRRAMRGRLPEPVRLRPKAVLAGDPIALRQHPDRLRWIDEFAGSPELDQYVERALLPSIAGEVDSSDVWINTRPFSLNLWLTGIASSRTNLEREMCYGING